MRQSDKPLCLGITRLGSAGAGGTESTSSADMRGTPVRRPSLYWEVANQ